MKGAASSATLAGQIKCNCAVESLLCVERPDIHQLSHAALLLRGTQVSQGHRLHLSIYHTEWPANQQALSLPLLLSHSQPLLLFLSLSLQFPHFYLSSFKSFYPHVYCTVYLIIFLSFSLRVCPSLFLSYSSFLSSLSLPSCEDLAERPWGSSIQMQEPETYGAFSTPKVNYSYLSRDCS